MTVKQVPNLKKHFLRVAQAEKDFEKQLDHLENLKKKQVKVVEAFFDELEKNPSKYEEKIVSGRKIRRRRLTLKSIRRHRRRFRKKVKKATLAELVECRRKKRCTPKSWCVRINRKETIFGFCCYLCLSLTPLQCYK